MEDVLRAMLVILLILFLNDAVRCSSECSSGLGVQSGTVPDSSISSQPALGRPWQGRLHSPRASWCFSAAHLNQHADTANNSRATWSVDLGHVRLVSGVLSQGPPVTLHPPVYSNTMHFSVQYSTDNQHFTVCCQSSVVMFQHHETVGETDRVQVHGFGRLVEARFVRVVFDMTSVWPGDPHKCFRFEITGCSSEWRPDITVRHVGHALGWVQLSWTRPSTSIRWHSLPIIHSLEVQQFGYRVQLLDDKSSSIQLESSQTSSADHTSQVQLDDGQWVMTSQQQAVLVRPVWWRFYLLHVMCRLSQHTTVNCGRYKFRAQLCASHSEHHSSVWCPQNNLLVFMQPRYMRAVWHNDQHTLLLSWRQGEQGWNSSLLNVTITDTRSSTILDQQTIASSITQLNTTQLPIHKEFIVSIAPVAVHVTNPAQYQCKVHLALIKHEVDIVEETGNTEHQQARAVKAAFVADVQVEAVSLHSGQLHVQWSRAVASSHHHSITASGYKVTVSVGPVVEVTVQLSRDTTQLTRGGLRSSAEYTVVVECQFGSSNITCGRASFSTEDVGRVKDRSSPSDSQQSAPSFIYHLPGIPVSWHTARRRCSMRGGALASVTTLQHEQQLQQLLNEHHVNAAWIGVQLCGATDSSMRSPSPSSSSSSSVSESLDESDSTGSGGGQSVCCVKIAREPLSSSWQLASNTARHHNQPVHWQSPSLAAAQTLHTSQHHASFQWHKELCDAPLLPACQINASAVQVQSVVNLTATSRESLTLDLSWSHGEDGWRSSAVTIQACVLRDLNNPGLRLSSSCSSWTMTAAATTSVSGGSHVKLHHLLGFHEYQVTITPQLADFNSSHHTTVTARILPSGAAMVRVSPLGHVQAVWCRYLVHFNDTRIVQAVIRQIDTPQSSHTAPLTFTDPRSTTSPAPLMRLRSDHVTTQPANQIRASGLQFGRTYQLILFDQHSNRSTEYVTFTARPTCGENEMQLNSTCFWSPDIQLSYDQLSDSVCQRHSDVQQHHVQSRQPAASTRHQISARVATASSQQAASLLQKLAETTGRTFWLGVETNHSLSPELTTSTPQDNGKRWLWRRSASRTDQHEDVQHARLEGGVEHSQLVPTPAPMSGGGQADCVYMTDRGQLVSERCTELRFLVCTRELRVELSEMPESSVWWRSEVDTVVIHWNTPASWHTIYTVSLRPRSSSSSSRFARAAGRSITLEQAPARLTNLTANTRYDVTITRRSAGSVVSLGPISLATLDPVYVRTGMFPRDQPHLLYLSCSYLVCLLAAAVSIIIIVMSKRCALLQHVLLICRCAVLMLWYLLLLLMNGGPLDVPDMSHHCDIVDALMFSLIGCALLAGLLRVLVLSRRVSSTTRSNCLVPRQRFLHEFSVVAATFIVPPVVAIGSYHLRLMTNQQRLSCWPQMSVDNGSLWLQLLVVALVFSCIVALAVVQLCCETGSVSETTSSRTQRSSDIAKFNNGTRSLNVCLSFCLSVQLVCCWLLSVVAFNFNNIVSLHTLTAFNLSVSVLLLAIAGVSVRRNNITTANTTTTTGNIMTHVQPLTRASKVSPISPVECVEPAPVTTTPS